jgi:hypothetical protein
MARLTELSDLRGKTLTKFEQVGSDEIQFATSDGFTGRIYHSQDCCETVRIHDVKGDFASLIGSPIRVVQESATELPPDGVIDDRDYVDSTTWTHQVLVTAAGGMVSIVWLGASNGYYGEGVSTLASDDQE